MSGQNSIKIGIPKGSLEAPTLALFDRVGWHFTGAERSLWLGSNDPEIIPVLLKPQEIPTYVQSGHLDAGLSGLDWIVEQDVLDDVRLLSELPYSRKTTQPIRWVLAVPERSTVHSVDDLRTECERRSLEGSQFTIATELIHISNMWLARNGIAAHAEFSWGATEAKASYFSDAIVEGTETGASLRANDLRVIAEVFVSTSRFFSNRNVYRSDPWKRSKLDGIAHLITGAAVANDQVQMTIVSAEWLDLSAILGADARLVTSTGPTENSPFHAIITLNNANVPRAMPAVIAAGVSDVWVAPLSVYYSESAPTSSPALSAITVGSPLSINENTALAAVNSGHILAAPDALVGVGPRP